MEAEEKEILRLINTPQCSLHCLLSLELDVLLLPFVEQAFDSLTFAEQETFERLLTCDDPDLFAWFMGHQTCHDPELAAMVKIVLERVKIKA